MTYSYPDTRRFRALGAQDARDGLRYGHSILGNDDLSDTEKHEYWLGWAMERWDE